MRTVEKEKRVNLGLDLLEHCAQPGVPLTAYDIAAWCDCTTAGIWRIEREALRKLANRIQFGRPELRELFAYYVRKDMIAPRRPGRKRAA